ncbi:hypothetical protein [Streptomyces anulatus]|uniref:hypothetical protein n=1 Tax=Streptomyces anulatus TaxID=1892 RepID=UPI0032E7F760
MASAMRGLPPRGSGQPGPWANWASSSPTPAAGQRGQRADDVRGGPGEQCGRRLAAESVGAEPGPVEQDPAQYGGCGAQPARAAQIGQQQVDHGVAVCQQRFHQPPPARPVRAEARAGGVQVVVGESDPVAVQRMGVADVGPQHPHAPSGEVELPEERRGHR